MARRERFFIADTGASIIYGEWAPNDEPEVVEAELLKLENALGDWHEPMIEARAAIIHDTQRHFDLEEDPDGDPWEDLNDEYLARKLEQGYPADILHRTGAMEEIATSETPWLITEREILFNTGDLPYYGVYHQGAQSFKALRARLAQLGVPSWKPLKGLPQREFIGISDECADEIEAIFVSWVGRTTDRIIDKGTGGGVRGPIREFTQVQTTKGIMGTYTGIPAFGGGTVVRGPRGRFIGATFEFSEGFH